MKSSDELINCIREFILEIQGLLPVEFSFCTADSRLVKTNSIFCVIDGNDDDGSKYLKDAIYRGATLIISSKILQSSAPQIVVSDVRKVLALLCAEFYDRPAEKLKVIAVTGTNGKTSTSYMIAHILNHCGYLTSLNGTVAGGLPGEMKASKLTTPGPEELHSFFADSAKAQAEFAVIEASSHGLNQERLFGLRFEAAIFTNLSSDHLDYHGTLDNYFSCKKKLFEEFQIAHSIVNSDDEYARKIKGYAFGKDAECRVKIDSIELHGFKIKPRVIGEFSLYNAAAAALTCLKILGTNQLDGIKSALESFNGVPGRMEVFGNLNKKAIVDFAHTEDALAKVLMELKENCTGKLILVFGCGGDRDRGRRFGMGKVSDLADEVIITNDNPRSEEPEQIVNDILNGKENYAEVIFDRAQAIEKAWGKIQTGDLLLVAGKGHEEKQIFADRIIEFSDREFLKNLAKG